MASPLLPSNRPPAPLPPAFAPKVSAAQLSPHDKRQLWTFLQAERPEKAAFFDDPIVRALMADGATPLFDHADCLAAGLAISPMEP